jgi:hypothetical protein
MIAQEPNPLFAKAVVTIIIVTGYAAAVAAFLYPVIMYILTQQ